MGVLYGRYDLLDRLTAYKVRSTPHPQTRRVGASLSLALTRPARATSTDKIGFLY